MREGKGRGRRKEYHQHRTTHSQEWKGGREGWEGGREGGKGRGRRKEHHQHQTAHSQEGKSGHLGGREGGKEGRGGEGRGRIKGLDSSTSQTLTSRETDEKCSGSRQDRSRQTAT